MREFEGNRGYLETDQSNMRVECIRGQRKQISATLRGCRWKKVESEEGVYVF
jgi:hypothetical protein